MNLIPLQSLMHYLYLVIIMIMHYSHRIRCADELHNTQTRDFSQVSATMSISPLLGSVQGLHTLHIRPQGSRNVNFTLGNDQISWFDLPNDGDLGEVPEFPVLSPEIETRNSTPRIPADLKGKGVE
jgi:hypothetical protein